MSLTFQALRGANRARLPQFKNSRGGKAHKKADGSDWTPAQWLQALVGELGELCAVRLAFERQEIGVAEFRIGVAKELADVATYLDLVAQRILDPVVDGESIADAAPALMEFMAVVGLLANERKKFDRGDLKREEFMQRVRTARSLAVTQAVWFKSLVETEAGTGQKVSISDPEGVDLGAAVVSKFNEVSERVGSTVRLHDTRLLDAVD